MLKTKTESAAKPYFKSACEDNIVSSCRKYSEISNDRKSIVKSCLNGDGEACYILSSREDFKKDSDSIRKLSCDLGFSSACKGGGK